jgi:hypothetical protein
MSQRWGYNIDQLNAMKHVGCIQDGTDDARVFLPPPKPKYNLYYNITVYNPLPTTSAFFHALQATDVRTGRFAYLCKIYGVILPTGGRTNT